jgi:hypothetical protein
VAKLAYASHAPAACAGPGTIQFQSVEIYFLNSLCGAHPLARQAASIRPGFGGQFVAKVPPRLAQLYAEAGTVPD